MARIAKFLQHTIAGAALLAWLPIALAAPPLSQAEFDAIVEEAVEVYRQAHRPDTFLHPPVPQWRHLDREKLARLLEMPEFIALGRSTKEPLIDQAGAWEMMPFDSPAAALAQWEKWLGYQGQPVPPGSRDAGGPPGSYYADHRWAPEASANVALMNCYPTPVWYVRHEEPMLWSLKNGGQWDQPNAFDFRKCILQQGDQGSPAWSKGEATPRGKSSAAILEGVFSRYLLANGCQGEGPNRCLPMLHALRALNPQHPSLVPILQRIEPDFALDREIVFPEAARKRQKNNSVADFEQARDIARQVLPRFFFLSAKIPSLLEQPEAWPPGEIDRTVGQLVDLSLALGVARWLQMPYTLPELSHYDDHFFADPWAPLIPRGIASPAVTQALQKWGRTHAQAPGCSLAETGAPHIPATFWIAYAEEKLEREQTTCGALREYLSGAGKRYGEAVTQNDASLLAPIAGLRRFLDSGSAAQQEVQELLSAYCPKTFQLGQPDPWQVCTAVAKARAEAEALRKAQEPPPPPPACAENLPARLAQRLGYPDEPDRQACKPMPDAPGRNILALSRLSEPLLGSSNDQMGSYDVDLLLVDAASERIQRHLKLEKAYESDAVRFEGIAIDTARYRLAPGVRAFGLRAEHSLHSSIGAYSEDHLSLFVETGSRLRRVLHDLVVYRYSGEFSGDQCFSGTFTEIKRSVAIAPTRSHGFADLLVTTTTTEIERHAAGDDCEETSHPVETRMLLRYDGKTYRIADELR